jgi:hypothetical protein
MTGLLIVAEHRKRFTCPLSIKATRIRIPYLA